MSILDDARAKSAGNGGGKTPGSPPVRRNEMVMRDLVLACLAGFALAQAGLPVWASALIGFVIWIGL